MEKNVCGVPKPRSVYFLPVSVVSTSRFPFISTWPQQVIAEANLSNYVIFLYLCFEALSRV